MADNETPWDVAVQAQTITGATDLIAHAPSDLAVLLAENERLRDAVAELVGRIEQAMSGSPEGFRATAPSIVRVTARELRAALDGAHPTPSDGSGTDG